MRNILGRLDKLSHRALLARYESIKTLLVQKGWANGYSDPTGYYAEQLFIDAYSGAKPASNPVNEGYDVVYRKKRYQIKARVNRPKELCESRKYKQYIKLDKGDGEFLFDVLVFVVLEKDFSVKQAFKIDADKIEDSGIGQIKDVNSKCCLRVNEASIKSAISNKWATDITDKIKSVQLD